MTKIKELIGTTEVVPSQTQLNPSFHSLEDMPGGNRASPWLLDLDYALAFFGLDLIHACDNLAGKFVERLGGP